MKKELSINRPNMKYINNMYYYVMNTVAKKKSLGKQFNVNPREFVMLKYYCY